MVRTTSAVRATYPPPQLSRTRRGALDTSRLKWRIEGLNEEKSAGQAAANARPDIPRRTLRARSSCRRAERAP